MPEKDNKRKSLRFAGRDIDSNDFVRYSQAGFNQYMLKNNLSEDQKQDAINSFNKMLPGIVNGSYSVSDFGKIEGGISANYSYDNKGKRVFGGEKTFNPYQFVETYLNGIVGAMKDSTATQQTEKQKWSTDTLYNRLTGSIFGKYVPSNISELSQSEQFLNWANKYDPYDQTTGKRSTENRTKFITEQLSEYRNDIVNGLYNLTDEDKEAELKRIDQMIGPDGLNPYSLGTLAPWVGHLLFTENKYQTAEQQEAARVQAEAQNYSNLKKTLSKFPLNQNAKLGNQVYKYSQGDAKLQSRVNKINSFKYLNAYLAYINGKEGLSDEEKASIKNLATYTYFNKLLKGYNSGIYSDWENGVIYIINKDNNQNINVDKQSISEYFNNASEPEQQELITSYNKKISGYKSGGILKASSGQKFLYNGPDGPDGDEENNKSSAKTPQQPTTPQQPITPTPDTKIELEEYILGENNGVPTLYEQTSNKTAHTISNPYDKAITALELGKYGVAKTGNLQNYWTLSQLSPVLKWANRTEYKTYTPVDIERQMALNEANFNQLGAQAATATSDQGAAFARQLTSRKALTQANNPLATQEQQMTNATVENSLKNENQNNQNQYDVAIGNNIAIVAAKNKQLINKAEFTKKNADLDVKRIMAEQYGIAAGAEQAFNEDMQYAVENDQTVKAAKADYNAAKEAYLASQTDETRAASRAALINAQNMYNEVVRQAFEDYKRSHKSPVGVPFVPPITRYFAKGGKTLEAEKEKTRRTILREREKTKRDYLKMFHDTLKQQSDHSYKRYRSAYDYYRKLMMQSN